MSIAAYKRTIRESESPRQIERRVFLRVTGEMEKHTAEFDSATKKLVRSELLAKGLRGVVAENLKLWSTIKHDLSQPENGLPIQLKAGLISLALFVERQTAIVLGGGAGLGTLVTINQSLIAGLSGAQPGPRG
ncbi:flagellar biosynthesis regulator FlaF [Pseudooceanicola nitratireducens]|uniref:flagellar biosynthesis regulator FlaF n=1 Tax=Pseudooceanicola nitratireducens TaxID=517719 RepID=UPI001C986DC5|nr:flagellar biosynthesis regulator FlaF [Pseudooceanicola nitratireducens]MBY6159047.1 flagellar biosynthesis regulator FlaF [Pseudooceanicola nitratireducens]MBY6167448.1 flagellar biosynthesis regulator FlaF [Pseudooceanicola nitratireducens]